jgi:hypothetical protein
MQSNKIHNVVLMSKFYSALFVSSTCFGPHRSIIRSVLYKLYSQTLVCGDTRTIRHVSRCNGWNVKNATQRIFAPFVSSLARQPIQQASSLFLGKDGDTGSSRNVLFLHCYIQTQTGQSSIGILCIIGNNPDTQLFIEKQFGGHAYVCITYFDVVNCE